LIGNNLSHEKPVTMEKSTLVSYAKEFPVIKKILKIIPGKR
jgi:hypothetical protein